MEPMKWPLHTSPLAHSYFASGMGILALTRRKAPACLGVGTPRTDFVRGDVVRGRLNMGYGISEIREREGEREGGVEIKIKMKIKRGGKGR